MTHKEIIKKYDEMEDIISNLIGEICLCHLDNKPFIFNECWKISYTKKDNQYQVMASNENTGEIIVAEGDEFDYPFDTIIKNVFDREIYG